MHQVSFGRQNLTPGLQSYRPDNDAPHYPCWLGEIQPALWSPWIHLDAQLRPRPRSLSLYRVGRAATSPPALVNNTLSASPREVWRSDLQSCAKFMPGSSPVATPLSSSAEAVLLLLPPLHILYTHVVHLMARPAGKHQSRFKKEQSGLAS